MMQFSINSGRTCLLLGAFLLIANAAFADVIVSDLPAPGGGSFFATLNNPVPGLDGYAVGFTQSTAYTNEAIAADVGAFSTSSIDGFLTDSLGNVIASDLNDTIATSSDAGLQTFFSGLSLAAGSYYLVLAPPTATTEAYWATTSGGATTLSPGSTYDGSFFAFGGSLTNPLSSFPGSISPTDFVFQVTGDSGSSAPEPGTWGTMLAGGLALAFAARRKFAK